MTFTATTSLADLASDHERPKRERDSEQCEVDRRARFEQGKCRDCERKRRATGKLCGHCRNRIEGNTVRDLEKQPRKGRMPLGEEDAQDLRLAMNSLLAGKSGLESVSGAHAKLTKFERRNAECEPMSQLLLAIKAMFEIAERRGVTQDWLVAIRRSLAD